METINREYDFIKFALPHVNFKQYDLIDIDEIKNMKRHQKIYPTRLFVTIQEKNAPPDDTWDWHSHGFLTSEVDDRPLRTRAVTIIEKRRRRKNKKTWETIVSEVKWITVLDTARRAEDHLYFLKQ